VAGTRVVTGRDAAGGWVTEAIESLVAQGGGESGDGAGQSVFARSEHDPLGELTSCPVTRTYERTAHALRVLRFRDDRGVEQTLRVTEEHPFYVPGAGWKRAESLAEGEKVLGASGTLLVLSNTSEPRPEGVSVYNIEVGSDHTYFVLAEDAGVDAEPVWVHNASNYRGVSPGEVSTYQSFRSRSVPGDGLEGHELLQHAWLKAHGHATTRLSTAASRANPVIALRAGGHMRIRPMQSILDINAQSALDNVLANRQIMLDLGYSRTSVNKLTRRAVDFINEFKL
jgi:hypothetical protein